jgi:hypothetical protein
MPSQVDMQTSKIDLQNWKKFILETEREMLRHDGGNFEDSRGKWCITCWHWQFLLGTLD